MIAIDDLARALGALRWAELRWFEVLGGWMRDETDARVRVALAQSCQRRATHADLVASRLPTYGSGDDAVTSERVTVPAHEWAGTIDAASATSTADRLVAFYRVGLSRLADEYGALLAATDARTDGPTHRLLSTVTADDADELAGAAALLRRWDVSDG